MLPYVIGISDMGDMLLFNTENSNASSKDKLAFARKMLSEEKLQEFEAKIANSQKNKMKNKNETEKNAVPPCYHAARVHPWSALPFCNSQLPDWGNGKVQSSPTSVYT